MDIIFKNYENPTYQLKFGGYFLPMDHYEIEANKEYYNNVVYKNEISDFVISSNDNISYCDEAEIITKININNEKYFDFNKSIIDIGANVGIYSFRTNFNKVYAFEPNKIMYNFLNFNLMIFDKYLSSEVYNVCLSDKNEVIEFDGFNTDQHLMNKNNIEKIYTHTLDEYNCEDVGLIKVDVEGMEEKVLRGGLGTIIRNNYPPILFECWGIIDDFSKNRHDLLEKLLIELGYDILWGWGNFQTHLAIHK